MKSLYFAGLASTAFLAGVANAGATGSDLSGVYTSISDAPESLCPPLINQTTYVSSGDKTFSLPHNTIIHNDKRCNGNNVRIFKYYDNDLFVEGSSLIPPGLSDMLSSVGTNVNAKFAMDQSEEKYFIGYEEVGRYCQDGSKFESGTTAFLFRPFKNVRLATIDTVFSPGRKYLIMVPRYANTMCAYESEISGKYDNDEDKNKATAEGKDDTKEAIEETPDATTEAEFDSLQSTPDVTASGLEEPIEPITFADEVSESSAEEVDDGSSCFPGDATVQLENGSLKPMTKLNLGDRVMVAAGEFSDVFMFTHKTSHSVTEFVRITTSTGNTLSLTRGHYMYINGVLAAAKTIKTGDYVELDTGAFSTVVAVSSSVERGLFNPQTISGDIVVNGMRASTFTTSVTPSVAQSLLAPVRVMYNTLGWSTSIFDNGAPKAKPIF